MHTTLPCFLYLLYAKQFNTTVCLWIPCLNCYWTLRMLLFEWLCPLWKFLNYDSVTVLRESTIWALLSNILLMRFGHCSSNGIWFINHTFLDTVLIFFVTCDLDAVAVCSLNSLLWYALWISNLDTAVIWFVKLRLDLYALWIFWLDPAVICFVNLRIGHYRCILCESLTWTLPKYACESSNWTLL